MVLSLLPLAIILLSGAERQCKDPICVSLEGTEFFPVLGGPDADFFIGAAACQVLSVRTESYRKHKPFMSRKILDFFAVARDQIFTVLS